MKLKCNSILVALVSVLWGGFAFGAETPVGTEIVWLRENGVTKTVYRITAENNTPFRCFKQALSEATANDVIEVRDAVFGDAKESFSSNQLTIDKNVEIVLGKANTSIGIKEDTSGSNGTAYPLKFEITKGAKVVFSNGYRICAQFEVEDGTLDLVGGQFFAPDTEDPIVLTSAADNDKESNVNISGAELLGIYEKSSTTSQRYSSAAIKLNSKGLLTLRSASKIKAYEYSRIKNVFYNGIVVLQGNAIVDGATISVDTAGISIGDNENAYNGNGGSCVVSGSSIVSDGDGIFAMVGKTNELSAVNSVTIALTNTTIASLNSGVNLCSKGDEKEGDQRSRVICDGTTITTKNISSSAYAIRDNSDGAWWDVQIERGTFYRMNKASEKWVVPAREGEVVSCVWNPTVGDDNLTLTVTREVSIKLDIVFHYHLDGDHGDCDQDIVTTTNYFIPYGGSWDVSGIRPTVANSNGVFKGWYATVNDAINHSNQVSVVRESGDLYAGWYDCRVTFKDKKVDDGVMNPDRKVGLADSVAGDRIQISYKPSSLGWTNHVGYSFVGWCYEGKDELITSIPIPVTETNNTLYAKWVEKKGGVAWIEDYEGTNVFKTVTEAIDEAKGRAVFLIDNVVDELIVIKERACLQLNGYYIGDANAAADEVIVVEGDGSTNVVLTIDGEGGSVYGYTKIRGGGALILNGGTYVCRTDPIVSAEGDNYVFSANGSVFKGAEDYLAFDFMGKGAASLTNSSVGCVVESKKVAFGISMDGGDLFVDGTTIDAGYQAVSITNATCLISGKASLVAPIGVCAIASQVEVKDSMITSTELDPDGESPYAFMLRDGGVGNGSLTLSGANIVVGGNSDESKAHKFVRGGLISYTEGWKDKINISGGTYSHQVSNDVVTSWIVSNCVAVWETDTRFVVDNPNAVYKIEYDATNNLPATAIAKGVAVTNPNTNTTYYASENYSFKNARCENVDGYSCEFQGWFFRDPTNSAYQVIAISNGCVVVQQGNSKVVTEITGDLIGGRALVAKWGNWVRTPCTVMFASGAIIKTVDEEDETFVTYHEVDLADEDDMKQNGISLDEGFPVDGLEFFESDGKITLPSGIHREGHTLKGWAVYYPDDLTDPENPPEWTNAFLVGEVSLKDFVDGDGALLDGATLHAVWDMGGGEWNPTFEDMYNGEHAAYMTGGDTYTGYVADENGQVVGTVTAKVGTPNADGEVSVSATIKVNGEKAQSFHCKHCEYRKDEIYADLGNEEHTFELWFNSKKMWGNYDDYYINGGVNLFKGTETDRTEAEKALSPFAGRWLFIFATEGADPENYKKFVHGELEDQDTEIDGSPFAYGYSYVTMEFKSKSKVRLSGKLANGKEVSATATAIVGDNMICVPANCAVYSGRRGGGFGFTAYFQSRGVDSASGAAGDDPMRGKEYRVAVEKESVSFWDSSMDKRMPFTAEVSYTNYQRVADVELPNDLLFCVDCDKPGWTVSMDPEKYGDLDAGSDWIPADPLLGFGYKQYISVLDPSGTGSYSMKAIGKAPGMKLVEDMYIVPKKKGDNYSGLKIKYDRKKGTFSGSFKVYTVRMDDDFKAHLKKTKVVVNGAVAEGLGYGFGLMKKVGSQPITLVNPDVDDRRDAIDQTVIPDEEEDEETSKGDENVGWRDSDEGSEPQDHSGDEKDEETEDS